MIPTGWRWHVKTVRVHGQKGSRIIEALAMCVRRWQQELNQDPNKSAHRSRQRLIDDELQQDLSLAGFTHRRPRYFQHR
jgi:hypothetical protein